jgi:hypothetical protein
MSNRLDVPPELLHLLEKREGDDRRSGAAAQAVRHDDASNADKAGEAIVICPSITDAPNNERRVNRGRRAEDRRSE